MLLSNYGFYKCSNCDISLHLAINENEFYDGELFKWRDIKHLITCKDYIVKNIIE